MTEQSHTAHPAFGWHSYGITHTGKVRKKNEDALLVDPENGLWAVADGMGGHRSGNTASQMIVKNLRDMGPTRSLEEFVDAVEDALIDTNTTLYGMAAEDQPGGRRATMGSTVALLRVYGRYCYYAWLGDSRLYRLRDGELRQMTIDHSQVEEYVEQGLISRREAQNHPHGNMVTRAIGVTANICLDMDLQELQLGDRYLLCSDGITKHVPDLELQELLGAGEVEQICSNLVATVLERGAKDNLTAIVVSILQAGTRTGQQQGETSSPSPSD